MCVSCQMFIVGFSVWEFRIRNHSRICWKLTLKEVFNFNNLPLQYGHYPFPEVYLMYITCQELDLRFSGDGLSLQ
jgi:hypothetical protein